MRSTGTDGLEHHHTEVNGVRLHYVKAGSGPLVMLLHGFPQHWYQFRHQLAAMADEYTVVAPDLRGYNLSAKPSDVHAYLTCCFVEDVRQLAVDLGHTDMLLAGHDVGGAIAWSFALHHPELLRGLLILDAPHPAVFDRALHTDAEQQEASSYLLFARRPDASRLFAADDFAVLRDALNEPFLPRPDLEAYVRSWQEPGALAAALRWFRAEGLGPPAEDGTPARGNTVTHVTPLRVDVPTVVIYPTGDRWIRPASHVGLEQYVPDLTFVEVEGGSHWVTDQHPEFVTEHLRMLARRVRDTGATPLSGRP
jgi:pimeloyl-ACP methyl ester carboxylesterase